MTKIIMALFLAFFSTSSYANTNCISIETAKQLMALEAEKHFDVDYALEVADSTTFYPDRKEFEARGQISRWDDLIIVMDCLGEVTEVTRKCVDDCD